MGPRGLFSNACIRAITLYISQVHCISVPNVTHRDEHREGIVFAAVLATRTAAGCKELLAVHGLIPPPCTRLSIITVYQIHIIMNCVNSAMLGRFYPQMRRSPEGSYSSALHPILSHSWYSC